MPLERQNFFQFGLLLLIVPAQYFIVSYFGTTQNQRADQLKQIVSVISYYKNQLTSIDLWREWIGKLAAGAALFGAKFSGVEVTSLKDQSDEGESPAIEVLKYREPQGYFAGSTEPRNPRPPNVKYSIGQVIRHKVYGYRGVIVGWDPVTRAPDYWIKQMYSSERKHLIRLPSYSVLVDTRDRAKAQRTYVNEDNIEILSATRILHPDVDEYFEGFDGYRYLPRPRLKVLYPND